MARSKRKPQKIVGFGERLEALGKLRGLNTQVEIAKKLEVQQSQISTWITGGGISAPTLSRIADILNTTMDFLAGRTDDPEPPLKLSPDEREFLDSYRRGSDDALDKAIGKRLKKTLPNKGNLPGTGKRS